MKDKNFRLGLYEKAMPNNVSWKEKLETAKNTGYDFVEMSIDETGQKLARLDMTKGERIEIVRLMKEKDIYFETMCLSGHRKYPLGSEDPKISEMSMQIMRKAIILARDLGIRMIQIAGYDEYYNPSTEKTRLNFANNLRASLEIAAQYGVLLAFETMETPFLNTVEKAMKWVKEMQSPYLAVYPDSGNLTNAAVEAGKNVVDDILTGKGHIAAFHLKETVPGKFREIPYGAGHVDFKTIIQTAYQIGVRRFTGEFWYVGQQNWKQVIEENICFLRRQFHESGF